MCEPCRGLCVPTHSANILSQNNILTHDNINNNNYYYEALVIEGRMLGTRPLQRPRSETLILEDGMYENIKREAMKRMIQGLTLPMAEHQRENMELSAIHFDPLCTLSAIIS